MSFLLNRLLGKISCTEVLRAPPGEGNGNGNAMPGGSETIESGDDDTTMNDGDEDDADLGIDDDLDGDDFDVDEYKGYQQTDADKQAAAALKTNLESIMENMTLDDSIFDENFDATDPASFKAALIAAQKQTAAQILSMVLPVMDHGLGIAGKQMKHYLDSKQSQTKNQSSAVEAFKTLGITDSGQVATAKTIFQQALKHNKGDTNKAVKATRKAFAAMGVPLKGGTGGTSRNNSSNPSSGASIKQGSDALNELFGDMPKSK